MGVKWVMVEKNRWEDGGEKMISNGVRKRRRGGREQWVMADERKDYLNGLEN